MWQKLVDSYQLLLFFTMITVIYCFVSFCVIVMLQQNITNTKINLNSWFYPNQTFCFQNFVPFLSIPKIIVKFYFFFPNWRYIHCFAFLRTCVLVCVGILCFVCDLVVLFDRKRKQTQIFDINVLEIRKKQFTCYTHFSCHCSS